MCPLQSIPVTYTRDRCAYVVDFTLYTVESTAFGRQGPEVQILSPRPFNSSVSKPLRQSTVTALYEMPSVVTLENLRRDVTG